MPRLVGMANKNWSFVLALCIAWQAIWFVGGWSAGLAHSDHDHNVLHTLGVPHHHDHHESSPELDRSLLAAAHLAADSSAFSPALIPDCFPVPLFARPASPVEEEVAQMLRPYLDGLERPPRLNA